MPLSLPAKAGRAGVRSCGRRRGWRCVHEAIDEYGPQNVILCDRKGAIYEGRDGLNESKEEMAKISNREMIKGGLEDVIKGADIFVGVSGPGILTKEMVETMNEKPIIFAMSNPTPEIMP